MDWKLIGEGIGIIAIIVGFFVFLSNNRKKIIFCKGVTDVLWCFNNFMIGAITGGVLNIVMVFREFVCFNRVDKKWAQHKFWMYFFSAMCFVSPVIECINAGAINWFAFFPAVGSVFAVFGFYSTEPARIRWLNFAAAVPWFIYTLTVNNVTCCISTVVNMTSVIVGVVNAKRAKKKAAAKSE